VSEAAPIAGALRGKRAGDEAVFKGKKIRVESVS
jgi:transcription elongation GreA/GreB family factor